VRKGKERGKYRVEESTNESKRKKDGFSFFSAVVSAALLLSMMMMMMTARTITVRSYHYHQQESKTITKRILCNRVMSNGQIIKLCSSLFFLSNEK
jgi:hypothetical protein